MAQSGGNINLEDFDEEQLTNELLTRLNDHRKEKDLPVLSLVSSLEKAARDQAEFNRKGNQVSNEQFSKKKLTVEDRVKYYGGSFYHLGEFDLGVEIDTKTTLKTSRRKNPTNYAELADHIMSEWRDERRLSDLLDDPAFYTLGVGLAPNKINNLVFATMVLGSENYEKVKNAKYSKNSYKINAYERQYCNVFQRNFEYIPELFSNNLRFEGRKIVFYYHDLSFIESMLESNRDMLAVDLMTKQQFSCEGGNRMNPSGVSDGFMLKPVNRSKLLKKNKFKDIQEFRAELGILPMGLDSNEVQLALLVIKDKCLCERVPYNNLNGANIRYLNVGLAIDTLSITQNIDSNSRYLRFTVPFEKNKYDYEVEDIKPFLDSIELNRFNIVEIDIHAYSSIEGNYMSNMQLQDRRAKSILKAIGEYQLQEVKTHIETSENWDGFYTSIKGSPYEENFRGLDHDAIRMIVNSDTLPYDLEPYLEGQRKADIRITVESIYIDSLTTDKLPSKLEKAIEEKDLIRAKAIQTLMYRATLDGTMKQSELFRQDIPQYKEYVDLLNNRIAFQMEFYRGKDRDSLIDKMKMEVDALLAIAPENGHVNFNRQAIKLYYWAKDIHFLTVDEENHIDQVKDFYKDIRKLYNTKIDNYKVNRLLLNYNIIAADFYYENQDYRNRIKALKQVKRYVQKAKLDRDQTFTMAMYFIYQMQIDWAIEIMYPFIRSDDYDAEFIMTFLSIAVYDSKAVKEERYLEYIEAAAEKFPEEFCHLYGKSGMSVEFLRDLSIKSVYCNTCHLGD